MGRTSALRDLRMERFPDVYEQWTSRQIGRAHAAGLLGVSEKTFRRYVARYRELGLKGLEDRRATSSRSASDEEIAALLALYTEHYPGWPVRKLHRAYTDLHGGTRSYTWVKRRLQEAVSSPHAVPHVNVMVGSPPRGCYFTRPVARLNGRQSESGSWWHWSMTQAIGFTRGFSSRAMRSGSGFGPSVRPLPPTACLKRFT